MHAEVFHIADNLADIWITAEKGATFNYAYGGTRLVKPEMDDENSLDILRNLMWYESSLKNRLINQAFHKGALRPYEEQLPTGLQESIVGGGRCLIRPKNQAVYTVLQNSGHPAFYEHISPLFARIGNALNEMDGKIKLTPDFGRFAQNADILWQYTPHVLGIQCEVGGCGGKSSYSSTGVIAAFECLQVDQSTPITLIGSAGAMGTGVLEYFSSHQEDYRDLAICDLVYNDNPPPTSEAYTVLPATANCFTEECLKRGGVIIATTIGGELEHSHWWTLPQGTRLLLAHNLAIPIGEQGITLMRQIAELGVFVLPGQLLTLGGALTSRLEWFWRQSHPKQPFDKPLAHAIVRSVVQLLVSEVCEYATSHKVSPYEAMLHYVAMDEAHTS